MNNINHTGWIYAIHSTKMWLKGTEWQSFILCQIWFIRSFMNKLLEKIICTKRHVYAKHYTRFNLSKCFQNINSYMHNTNYTWLFLYVCFFFRYVKYNPTCKLDRHFHRIKLYKLYEIYLLYKYIRLFFMIITCKVY